MHSLVADIIQILWGLESYRRGHSWWHLVARLIYGSLASDACTYHGWAPKGLLPLKLNVSFFKALLFNSDNTDLLVISTGYWNFRHLHFSMAKVLPQLSTVARHSRGSCISISKVWWEGDAINVYAQQHYRCLTTNAPWLEPIVLSRTTNTAAATSTPWSRYHHWICNVMSTKYRPG